MIKYSEGELLDVLHPPVSVSNKVIAVSYAIKMATQKLIEFAALTKLYANIDGLTDEILDLLAIELQTQYYDSDLAIEVKRSLISNTLLWYKKVGTPSVIIELVEKIFDSAVVEEWYDYGDAAYYFRITTNASEDEDTQLAQLEKLIDSVKNVRSHLSAVTFTILYNQTISMSIGTITETQLVAYPVSDIEIYYILYIEDDTIMTVSVWPDTVSTEYDSLSSYEVLSASYDDGNLVIEMPSNLLWTIV